MPIYDPVAHKSILEAFLKEKPKTKPPKDDAKSKLDSILKGPEVTLGRLMKTEAYAPLSFIPEQSFSDSEKLELFEDLSEKIRLHFKEKY